MAVQIPNTLYTGGNVEFDSTPSVKFYQQIEAERRAKQDAIDDYMRGLRGKITPAGMAVNDIPAFDTMRKKWQEFGVQNRDRIARDPQARAEFESMAADLISLAERSKAKVKAGEPVIGMLSKKENADQIRPEWMAEYDKAMSPLMKQNPDGTFEWDYDRKDIDFTKDIWKPTKVDFLERYDKKWKGDAKPDIVVSTDKPYTDKQTGLVFFPKTEQYSKDAIKRISQNAARDISENENDLLYYRDRLAGAIKFDEYSKLDNIHRKYFGTPIGNDKDAPKRLAAAEAAYAAEQEVRNLEPVSKLDYERRQEDKRINISLNQGRGGGAAPPQTIEGNEFDRIKPIKKTGLIGGITGGYKQLAPNEIPERTKAVLKSAGIDLEGAVYFDVDVDIDGNVQSITPYFQYDKEGKDVRKSGKITRQDMFDAQLKYNSEPQKGQQPTFGQQPTRVPKDIKQTKLQPKKDPLGLGL